VSMNDAKLAPLCSINEIAMDFYDWTVLHV
jgi:hypothetical protein